MTQELNQQEQQDTQEILENEQEEKQSEAKVNEQSEEKSKAENSTEKEKTENSEEEEIYGKPENYDFSNVELAQGMTLEPESTKEFSELAAKCNLSQKTADEFVKIGAKLVEKSVNNVFAQLQAEQIEQYKLATNTDPEIGGEKLNEALDIAELAYKEFATPKLKEFLQQAGLNYHNEVIKTFRNIGLKMKESNIFNADSPQGQNKTAAQILYGS